MSDEYPISINTFTPSGRKNATVTGNYHSIREIKRQALNSLNNEYEDEDDWQFLIGNVLTEGIADMNTIRNSSGSLSMRKKPMRKF